MAAETLDGLVPDWGRDALFLDFDGTLAPIVARPELATIAPTTREVLAALLELTGGAVAILSGRGLADLDTKLAPLKIAAAGAHGAELRRAGDVPGAAPEMAPALMPAHADLTAFAARHGLLLERKSGAVTLHYRAQPALAAECRALVERLAEGPGLRAMHGLMVSEVALAGIDKGTALRTFMAEPPFAGRRPIAAGDDTTDEDAIRAAQALGGAGIRIGDAPTAAHHRAPSIAAFLDWLARAAVPARSAG